MAGAVVAGAVVAGAVVAEGGVVTDDDVLVDAAVVGVVATETLGVVAPATVVDVAAVAGRLEAHEGLDDRSGRQRNLVLLRRGDEGQGVHGAVVEVDRLGISGLVDPRRLRGLREGVVAHVDVPGAPAALVAVDVQLAPGHLQLAGVDLQADGAGKQTEGGVLARGGRLGRVDVDDAVALGRDPDRILGRLDVGLQLAADVDGERRALGGAHRRCRRVARRVDLMEPPVPAGDRADEAEHDDEQDDAVIRPRRMTARGAASPCPCRTGNLLAGRCLSHCVAQGSRRRAP